VPGTVAISTDGAVCDTPLVVMEHVEGAVIDDEEGASRVPEERRRAVSRSLARTLATIHDVDLQATGLTGLASGAPYAARQLKRWRRQWELSKTRAQPRAHVLHQRLAASAPAQRKVTLVHGDYHLLNVITAPDDGAVRAVLDWELSTLGEPLADLGALLAYWWQADDPVAIGPFAFTRLPGFATRAELAAEYADASGRDLSDLPFWEALASWKIAIILEGVRRRALSEPRLGQPIDVAVIDALFLRAAEIADAAAL
jgi:aminoglycoside phosphotransferase (APT) family kinase protein